MRELYRDERLFFLPWIGEEYEEGIALKDAPKPLKLLIIGARRHCRYSVKQEMDGKDLCPLLEKPQ